MVLVDFQDHQFFMIFDPHDVLHVTWRRVLRTPLPLLEGVPQVMFPEMVRSTLLQVTQGRQIASDPILHNPFSGLL